MGMSGFTGGRRAPNVSQYLADLNTIPGPQDLSGQQNDFGGLGDDLDFLTNTEFFDFDNLNNVDFSQPAPADLSQPQPNGLQGPFPQQAPAFSPQQPITGDKRKA